MYDDEMFRLEILGNLINTVNVRRCTHDSAQRQLLKNQEIIILMQFKQMLNPIAWKNAIARYEVECNRND